MGARTERSRVGQVGIVHTITMDSVALEATCLRNDAGSSEVGRVEADDGTQEPLILSEQHHLVDERTLS